MTRIESPNDPRISPDRVLEADTDLEEFLDVLLQDALRRQIWLLFLDADHRLIGPIMPMDDHPMRPDEVCATDDLGDVPFSRVLLARAGMIAEALDAASCVVVHERAGAAKPSAEVDEWALALRREATEAGLPLRTQFLLHDAGVAMIPADRELQR